MGIAKEIKRGNAREHTKEIYEPPSIPESILNDVRDFSEEHHLSRPQLRLIFSRRVVSELDVQRNSFPLYIFDRKTSALESTVKYLKENRGRKISDIARLMNRSSKTIWATYHHAAEKAPEPYPEKRSRLRIPIHILEDRRLGAQEAIVRHLKDEGLNYHQIAEILGRDERTIWTAYHRAKEKTSGRTKDRRKEGLEEG
ncbi:MAG: sigma factor-like helix-turn-helix DNA-binding protein [Candidatus Woesearchaeota archaeon]